MIDKYKKILTPIIAVLLLMVAIKSYLPSFQTEQKNGDLYGPYAVTKIIDGDTIDINDKGKVRLRLIGINTPERDMPYYQEATDFTANLVKGKKVYLEYDKERYDKYGRTLAYIYLEDGETMLNYQIIRAGWAKTINIKPNTSKAGLFKEAYEQAKKEKIGIHQKK